MDSLQVATTGNASKTSSRSTSPCRQQLLSTGGSQPVTQGSVTTVSSHSNSKNALAWRTGNGSSGSGSSAGDVTMSVSSHKNRKSPVALRRNRETGSAEGGNLHISRAEPISQEGSQEEVMAQQRMTEEEEEIILPSLSYVHNGSTEHVTNNMSFDEVDGNVSGTSDLLRIRAAIDRMQSKINRTRELIRGEQTTRDDNVNEYLKLAANADKQQLQRIKAVFEKKKSKVCTVDFSVTKEIRKLQ